MATAGGAASGSLAGRSSALLGSLLALPPAETTSAVIERHLEVTATLPKGARIISTVAAGERITVTIQIADAIEIRTFDAKTLQPAGRLKFLAEP